MEHRLAQQNLAKASKEIQFLQQAVRINTVSHQGNEYVLAQMLAKQLKSHGFHCALHRLDGQRANLVATLRSQRPGPRLVLTGHLDTVPVGSAPWRHDPFGAVIDKGVLYGRGSVDMKGGLVAAMYSLIRFAQLPSDSWAGEVVLAATSTEETGAEGAQVMVEEGQLKPFDGLIVAEPTDNQLVIAHKGALWAQVESHGKAAHSSMPEQGVNAIDNLFSFYTQLHQLDLSAPDHKLLKHATLAVTTVEGGMQYNVVPDYGRLVFDIRTLPGQDHEQLLKQVQLICAHIMAKNSQIKLNTSHLLNIPAVSTDEKAPLVKIAMQVLHQLDAQSQPIQPKGARYFTDASVLQVLGKEIIVLGPGNPALAHQTNEHVHLVDFLQAIEIYQEILKAKLMI